jgi:hypothetical protein
MDFGSFLSSVAPDVGQVAATAVRDFASSGPANPPPTVPGVVTPYTAPSGAPVVLPQNAPVYVPGAAANPSTALAPAPPSGGILATIKHLPLPTKLLAGGALAVAAYMLLGRR